MIVPATRRKGWPGTLFQACLCLVLTVGLAFLFPPGEVLGVNWAKLHLERENLPPETDPPWPHEYPDREDALFHVNPIFFLDSPLVKARDHLNVNNRINVWNDITLWVQGAPDVINGEPHMMTQWRFDLNLACHLTKSTLIVANARGGTFIDEPYGSDLKNSIGTIEAANNAGLNTSIYLYRLLIIQALWDYKIMLRFGYDHSWYHFDLNSLAQDETQNFTASNFCQNRAFQLAGQSRAGTVNVKPVPWLELQAMLMNGANNGPDSEKDPFKTMDHMEPNVYYGVNFYPAVTMGGKKLAGQYRFFGVRSWVTGVSGSGFGLSFNQNFPGNVLTWLRASYGDPGTASYRWFVSGGFGFDRPFGRDEDRFGIGVAWGDPVGHRDEIWFEAFYRMLVFPSITMSPDIQLIVNPATWTPRDVAWIFGWRFSWRFG